MWCPRLISPYKEEADYTLRSTTLGMIGEIDGVDGERVKVRIDVGNAILIATMCQDAGAIFRVTSEEVPRNERQTDVAR